MKPASARKATHQHDYRLAVYGRPNSGKTCILAALAMMREPHPNGFSCVWICDETTVPTPTGDRTTWNLEDPKVAAYLGKEALREAIQRIEVGDVPKATPFTAPYRFYFDFTTPEGRVLRVELIDYTGEFVNPDLSEDVMVKRLRQHLEEADGVVVLAEASRPGDEYAPLFRELQRLQQAFMAIAESRRGKQTDRYPIALVLNKWDRVTKLQWFTPAECEVETARFLERRPTVPQKSLSNVLAAVAGRDGDQVLSKTFGLSAFGKAKIVKKQTDKGVVSIDVPLSTHPLPSFGLEDPFVWLCESADAVAERDLQQTCASLGPWKLWQLWSGRARSKRVPRPGLLADVIHEALDKAN